MSESKVADSVSPHSTDSKTSNTQIQTRSWLLTVPFIAIILPVIMAVVCLYHLDPLEPVEFPNNITWSTLTVSRRNKNMRQGSETIAEGNVMGPEDLVYDAVSGVIYTGCEDGWIKRVTLNESVSDSVIENWINTGGRPLGLAFDRNSELIVADADKGLLRVTKEKEIEVLVDEVDGLKFKLTDGVDVADDGTIYFTDASHKYSVKDSILDLLEGNPNGRFLSYNPTTKITTLLLHDLYFPNGVAVSPDQLFVIFCETILGRCKKYYIQGSKKGSIEIFCELPGMPDNIHYDGNGQYWIGLATAFSTELDILLKYPFLRKVLAIVTKHVPSLRLSASKNGGVIAVDLEGKPTAHYYDPKLSVTTGIKIGKYIYCGSISYPFILRLDVHQYPALPTI